mmetsp:Transcript_157568/g.278044  ORF Transcript_157568/g.278044 Transcript_157568/m.278044 type:complete len:517 (-) Transcript_157568:37-1587(-)
MWAGSALAILLRYLLFVTGAPAYLEEHLALTSPITSYLRLKEGLFLLDGGTSPYAGGSCHHPPLLLLLAFPLRHAPALLHFTVIVAVDVATALLLRLLAVKYAAARSAAGKSWLEARMRLPCIGDQKGTSSTQKPFTIEDVSTSALEDQVSPAFVGLSYLFNPFVIGSCLAQSLQNIHHFGICGAVCLAAYGRGGMAAAAAAVTLYVCPFTPIVLLVPLAYLSFLQSQPSTRVPADERKEEQFNYTRSKDERLWDSGFVRYLIFFILTVTLLFACLLVASLAVMDGQAHFLQASFVSVLALKDLTPNVGLFWYMFIEVFDRYRDMFLVAFHAHLLFYPIPLHLRMGRHLPVGPWLHCGAAVALVTIFKPYPTASDFGLMLSILLVHAEIIQASDKYFAFLLSGLLFGLSMFPTMTSVWLRRNAGNANFLYNMTLVTNFFSSILLSEWIKSCMKLRKRQRLEAFCRGITLDIVQQAVEQGSEKRQTQSAPAAESGPRDEAATSAEDAKGLRHRRGAA